MKILESFKHLRYNPKCPFCHSTQKANRYIEGFKIYLNLDPTPWTCHSCGKKLAFKVWDLVIFWVIFFPLFLFIIGNVFKLFEGGESAGIILVILIASIIPAMAIAGKFMKIEKRK